MAASRKKKAEAAASNGGEGGAPKTARTAEGKGSKGTPGPPAAPNYSTVNNLLGANWVDVPTMPSNPDFDGPPTVQKVCPSCGKEAPIDSNGLAV